MTRYPRKLGSALAKHITNLIMAGSGKSFLGAMDFLKYTDDPKFRGLVVRRLTPQIQGPGGIFETFQNLHRDMYNNKLKVKKRDGILEYPNGGTVSFRHCQYEEDKHSFQGKFPALCCGNTT